MALVHLDVDEPFPARRVDEALHADQDAGVGPVVRFSAGRCSGLDQVGTMISDPTRSTLGWRGRPGRDPAPAPSICTVPTCEAHPPAALSDIISLVLLRGRHAR